jgi:uncharacterized protein (UPF0335 family)
METTNPFDQAESTLKECKAIIERIDNLRASCNKMIDEIKTVQQDTRSIMTHPTLGLLHAA